MYKVPVKRIITKEHLDQYLQSDAYQSFIEYIIRLNDAVCDLKIDTELTLSPNVKAILNVLSVLKEYIKAIPAVENSKSRFGNPSFRDFYDRVEANAAELMGRFVKPTEAIPEVARYFVESFGNRKRIDYGTGHEANFMAWLLCLEKLGVLTSEDDRAVVLRVFVEYIAVMRQLQFEYWLEPAGSHGVWGLDDYHFLPFMFGSSQLKNHKYIRPKSIHDEDTVCEFSKSYMYLACIRFINEVKTSASLRWHSPMLDDISACKTWIKVNQGMIKMYKAEVLGKLPIMQHFMFGSLIHFEGGVENAEELEDKDCGHNHSTDQYAMGQEYPDCCGIPVPSAIAATATRKQQRPIPFD
ncbi:Phosphotyrosyl phosphatase activator [Dichotomocladium elegans]|nr:Phosphotyrosyl phosphatase activator [Dichotomocladium elegans]